MQIQLLHVAVKSFKPFLVTMLKRMMLCIYYQLQISSYCARRMHTYKVAILASWSGGDGGLFVMKFSPDLGAHFLTTPIQIQTASTLSL